MITPGSSIRVALFRWNFPPNPNDLCLSLSIRFGLFTQNVSLLAVPRLHQACLPFKVPSNLGTHRDLKQFGCLFHAVSVVQESPNTFCTVPRYTSPQRSYFHLLRGCTGMNFAVVDVETANADLSSICQIGRS